MMHTHPIRDDVEGLPERPARSRRRSRIVRALLLASVAAAAGVAHTPAATAARVASVATVVSEDARGVVLVLEAPSPVWREANGYRYPSLAGFGLLQQASQPALPIRIERVGVPNGAEPRLTILNASFAPSAGRNVGPAQRWVPILPGSDQLVPVDSEDPAVYGVDALFPSEQPVRLGAIGALREQPFVELIFTPVLFNPARHEALSYTKVTVRVDFGDVPAGVTPAEADPAFDDVYGQALVNARQARGLRGARRAVWEPREPAASPEEAPPSLAPIGPQYKLGVSKDGVYRLTGTWLASNAAGLAGSGPGTYRIVCQGQQIPITVVDANSDGTLTGTTDYVEFFGQALSWDILSPDEWNGGDYTDENVYWLYADSVPGLRAPARSGVPGDVFTIPSEFVRTIRHEIDDRFVQQSPQASPESPTDHWYQSPPVFANNSAVNVNFSVNTPGLSSSTSDASIKARLLGGNYSNNYHRSAIKVNGTTVSGPTNWDGFRDFTHGADDGPALFSQSIMNDGSPDTTTVTVSLPLGRTVGPTQILFDNVFLNWIEVTYKKQFRVDADETLIFTVPNQNSQFHVTGLSQNASAVYEITQTVAGTPLYSPVRVTGVRGGGAGPFHADFQITADGGLPATRRFVVATVTGSGTTGDLTPAGVRLDTPSSLHSPPQGADWLVVANASFIDNDVNSSWKALVTRRTNQGLRVAVVDVEDVYDEFSYGIQDPQAIRDFFTFVYDNWPRSSPNVPLRYGILLGDASYDYKNGYGHAQNKNLLSTYMRSVSASNVLGYTSDESFFSTVSGSDVYPDFHLGRIPVHSLAETNAVAKKILDYETAAAGQLWQHNVVFVADDDETSFENIQNSQIDAYLAGTPHTYDKNYESRMPGWPPPTQAIANEAKDRFQRQLNGQVDAGRDIGPGAAIVSYVGHGGFQTWGSNFSIFAVASTGPDDLAPVTNATKLPLLLIADCIAGGFAATNAPTSADVTYAFGEKFVVAAGKGAIGAIAPSHLTFLSTHDYVLSRFFADAYGPTKTRNMGKLMLGIQLEFGGIGDTNDLRSYTFLGDPAVNLPVPAPAAPTGVAAAAGNHQVTVSWVAAPGASSYKVYQSENPAGPYTAVASGVTGTSRVVTGLVNCTPYYYVVTSANSGLFEGPYSHFNTGCGSGGPCVTATPRNPVVPTAPAGVTATDRETGGAVLVAWSPNPSGQEVDDYRVYWGISPGPDSDSQAVGTATSHLVTGLIDGQTYHFTVRASSCSQGLGPPSAEVSAVPRRIEGIKPPDSIDGLRVYRSPHTGDGIDDTRLQWTPPTVNIYGQPTILDHQEVYAGTTPTFPVDAAHRLAIISGTQSFYIHANGFGAGPNTYYLIVAEDTNQNRSGIGRELPRGIDNLALTRSGGTLLLTWPAVTRDLDGRPTLIDHYVLYGRSTPFSRSQISPALLVRDNLTGTGTAIPMPAGQLFCYSVIAVDNRGALSPY